MPLLSRVYKKPCISGICSYQIPGLEAGASGYAPGKGVEKRSEQPACTAQPRSGVALPPENKSPAARAGGGSLEDAAKPGCPEEAENRRAEAEAGAKELLKKASRKLEEAEQEAAACLQQARLRAREIVSASENEIVELSVAIAEKLIQDQLEIAPRKVAGIVRKTMSRHFPREEEQLEVYLHPVDLPACRKDLEQFAEVSAAGAGIKLLPDEQLSRGSCRIESESSMVEYLLNDELERIRETLLQIAPAKEQKESREEALAYAGH